MADKSQQLIVEALTRAATEPHGLPLYAQKSEPGLFPATTTAKAIADRAKADGLLHVIECEAKGKNLREVCVLTEKGMQFLARQASPRQVLEDFVRVLEARQAEVDQMGAHLTRMADGMQSIKAAVAAVLPRLIEQTPTNGKPMNSTLPMSKPTFVASDELIADVKARLAEWHASAGASQDCPLPDLYRQLESRSPVSIGLFHDALRQLHDDHQIYLHPWTGPLYALPEPCYALLVGHGVAYYASIR